MTTHDLVGIGIGPFNLGLAALADPLDLDAVFLDAADEFRWHPGMMIEGSTIQVPFLADLVTMADPTSRYSFLAFLKATGRLYPFYIRESFYPLRAEYDAYCRWVADRLGSLRWGRRVVSLDEDGDDYVVTAVRAGGEVETYRARHVVLGVGTRPVLPAAVRDVPGVVHSSEYLTHRDRLRAARSVTVVGSGQSAAEIYRDLLGDLGDRDRRLDWVTRSPRFFPMEYTKLTLEMTSPEYTDHFHGLPAAVRQRLAREQRSLSKGISSALVDDIFDTLYRLSVDGPVATTLLTDTSLVAARPDGDGFELRLRHEQLGEEFSRRTDALVVATGYAAQVPDFVMGVRHRIDWDDDGRFAVARDYSIDGGRGRLFVQNAEEHTHGVTAPDLGFGPWRSSSILASVTGREVYPREERIAFQEFGVPAASRLVGVGEA
ncbi:monooxygenase [Cellulomonas chitinilytica]|uniref:L-lysine N6-monooxygenase MbtG n=1 Tax=Cellulomonas chitinilytica TaxID=398759 RepID=A0A919U4H9_9CELL|nr:lysine N(6)-hydroxylase/L-ornithine N(5)-oxygenase family protein [Cellulomonas chitinilytica]GIG23467.1 monooxygenase [Cellulomonas chitinilytica]